MIFKRPETLNNFFLFEEIAHVRTGWYVDSVLDIGELKERDKLIWEKAWQEFLRIPLNFWTLIVIMEHALRLDEAQYPVFELSDLGNPVQQPQLFEKFDKEIYSEIHGPDFPLVNGASFQFTIFRLAEACWLFLAFDIRDVFFTRYVEDIINDQFQRVLLAARKERNYGSGDDRDYFLSQVHYLQKDYSGRSIYWKGVWYEDIPDSDDPQDDFFSIIHLLWEELSVQIDIDKENLLALHESLYSEISFDCSFHKNLYTAKLVERVWECEVVGNLLRIPTKLILEADFPLIQFLWYLSSNDSIYVFNWRIDEFLDVEVSWESSLLKAMGIDSHGAINNAGDEKSLRLGAYIKYDHVRRLFINAERPGITCSIQSKKVFFELFKILVESDWKGVEMNSLSRYATISADFKEWKKKGAKKWGKWDWDTYCRSKAKNLIDKVHKDLELEGKRFSFITFHDKCLALDLSHK